MTVTIILFVLGISNSAMERSTHLFCCFCMLVYLDIVSAFSAKGNSPSKIIDVKNITAVAGKDRRILLTCPYFKSTPVLWTKDGNNIHQSKSTHISLGTLAVTRIAFEAEGQYECSFRDLYGYHYKAIFNVTVNESPRILQRSRRHIYANNSTVVLNCKANGKPKPDIFWINDRGFSPISPPTITLVGTSSLQIKGLKKSDSKTFICIAQNIHGRAKMKFMIDSVMNKSSKIMKKEKNKEKDMPIKRKIKQKEAQAENAGKVFKKSSPNLKRTRIKEKERSEKKKVERKKKKTEKSIKATIRPTHLFKIKKAKQKERKVQKIGKAPVFVSRPRRIFYVSLGKSVKFNCDAKGFPKPKTIISKMRPIKVKLQTNVIQRFGFRHIGLYECKASNVFGTITYLFLLRLKDYGRNTGYKINGRRIYSTYKSAFTSWSSWSSCSNQCGMGIEKRTRRCRVISLRYKSRLCKGLTVLRRMCYRNNCSRKAS